MALNDKKIRHREVFMSRVKRGCEVIVNVLKGIGEVIVKCFTKVRVEGKGTFARWLMK